MSGAAQAMFAELEYGAEERKTRRPTGSTVAHLGLNGIYSI